MALGRSSVKLGSSLTSPCSSALALQLLPPLEAGREQSPKSSLRSHGYPGICCTCAHSRKAHGCRALVARPQELAEEVAAHPHGSGRQPVTWEAHDGPHLGSVLFLHMHLHRLGPLTPRDSSTRYSQVETAVISVVTLR